ncbi:arylsulfatase [Actinocorallia longicatena]|uniref:Arylsulfatase n=1 Tax=Actinocorallia longicatena TaxID=111803 RepID=A0ABP6QQA4_9ACTN
MVTPQSDLQRPVEPKPGTTGGKSGLPSFILIVADDLGWSEVGCYGQKKIKTPRIDAMASQGLRFTDAYSSAPVCAPARSSLLTGLHTGHTTVRRNPPPAGDIPLGPQDVTIGQMLRDRGYRTGLFGKWGFGPDRSGQPSHPNEKGFTDFFGYLTHHQSKSYFPTHLWDNQRKVILPGNTGDFGAIYGPDLIMQRVADFLRQENGQAPFFLMLSLPLPHAPSVVPSFGQYAGKDWKPQNKAHAEQITTLDGYVGLIIDQLRRQGLDDNTIVMFSGDNGPHEEDGVSVGFFNANGPYRGIKRNLYEGGIRVPFIVWSPRLLQHTAGKKTAHATAHYDLMATLADFSGAQAPANDGLSLRRVFTGKGKAPQHKFLYWARTHAGQTPTHRKEDHNRGRRAAVAVRFKGHWKLVGFAPGKEYSKPGRRWKFELYDLKKDPGEKRNLAADRPDLVKEAKAYAISSWRHPK